MIIDNIMFSGKYWTQDFVDGLVYFLEGFDQDYKLEGSFEVKSQVVKSHLLGNVPKKDYKPYRPTEESIRNYIIRSIGRDDFIMERYLVELHLQAEDEELIEYVTFGNLDFLDGLIAVTNWLNLAVTYDGYYDLSVSSKKKFRVQHSAVQKLH